MSAANRALTGGTGDVNPQWFRFAADGALTIGAVVASVAQTPLAAFNNVPGNKAVVMEVLKVAFSADPTFTGVGLIVNQMYIRMGLFAGTRPTTQLVSAWSEPTCIAYIGRSGTTTSSQSIDENQHPTSWEVDLTDGAGHGVLLGANTVTWLHEVNTGAATVNSLPKSCAFLYRFKEVSLQEYMGIIQSQQTPST